MAAATPADKPQTRDDFHVGIICALPLEYDAVTHAFDHFWDEKGDEFGKADGDTNNYTTGRMGGHDVVLAVLPGMGKKNATGAAVSMRSSYTRLHLVLVVGVCGGIPIHDKKEMFLGDVVISDIVLQYDLGTLYPGEFVRKDTLADSLGRPNNNLRGLLATFRTDRGQDKLKEGAEAALEHIRTNAGPLRRQKYEYPGAAKDQLFWLNHRHKHYVPNECKCSSALRLTDAVCAEALKKPCTDLGCVTESAILRTRPDDQPTDPKIYIGKVASGDLVIKSAQDRDQLHTETESIAFEMEGAGVWEEAPCIVIKGICDYADTHKNKDWQPYAAATAASVSKAVLGRYIRTDKSEGQRRREAAAAQASSKRGGITFNGPIIGRNVTSGMTVSEGSTANFNFS